MKILGWKLHEAMEDVRDVTIGSIWFFTLLPMDIGCQRHQSAKVVCVTVFFSVLSYLSVSLAMIPPA